MSSQSIIEFQKMLLNVVTNELTSHGAMLFAGLISSFHFLRFIYERYRKLWGLTIWSKIILYIGLTVLLSFSIYVIERLIFWGRTLHVTMSFVPSGYNFASFYKYHQKVNSIVVNTTHPLIAPFIFRERFHPWRYFVRDLSGGSIVSVALFYAIGIFSGKYARIYFVISLLMLFSSFILYFYP